MESEKACLQILFDDYSFVEYSTGHYGSESLELTSAFVDELIRFNRKIKSFGITAYIEVNFTHCQFNMDNENFGHVWFIGCRTLSDDSFGDTYYDLDEVLIPDASDILKHEGSIVDINLILKEI